MEKLLLLLPLFSVVTSSTGDYSDVQALGVACPPRDTCSNITGRTFSKSSCECDNWCNLFDDCCIDAPSRRRDNVTHNFFCLQVESNQGVYVIQKCNNSWNGSDVVRRKCEDEEDFSDPLMSLPTTDTRTNVTYRNHFCAECNYGSLDRLSSWKITLTCSSLEDLHNLHGNITMDFIVRNITRSGSSWGVYHWNESLADRMFYPCEVSFQLPDSLEPHLRYCRPQLISECLDDWKRETVKELCESYMAVILIHGQAYRNAHCALCNRIPVRNLICDSPALTGRKKGSLSFTLLLDVNESDGGNVGESNHCSSGQTYDPFAKICRPLVCALPGHVYRGGRCVPE